MEGRPPTISVTVPGLSHGAVCVILRLAVLVQCRLVADGRIDGRTHDDGSEMDMGWVNPWVGLGWVWVRIFHFVMGWVWLGPTKKLMFLFIRYLFIYYIFLTVIPNKRNHIHRLKMAQYLCAPICIWKTIVNSLT